MKPSKILQKYGWFLQSAYNGVTRYAKDKDGNFVSTKSDQACYFCLFGAIERVYPNNWQENNRVLRTLEHKLNLQEFTLDKWASHPDRTKKEMIEVLVSIGE